MTEPSCPRCKTTKYTNPSLKLMVNVCGHTLCESCVQTLYIQGSGKCYECNVILRRNNFRTQQFEDPLVERDVDIRRRILKDFNKKEEDFGTLLEFNNYLEMVETIIFNLVNDIDREETLRQVEEYKAAHQEEIKKNRSKLGKELQELNDLIEEERVELERNRLQVQMEANQAKMRKVKEKDELINELMLSDRPAEHIIQTHMNVTASAASLVPQVNYPTIVKTTATTSSFNRLNRPTDSNQMRVPLSTTDVTPVMFTYEPITFDYMGVSPPSTTEELAKYLRNVRNATVSERAGGYESSISCQRALQDAFCGLYYTATDHLGFAL